jgi:hypothetical protein
VKWDRFCDPFSEAFSVLDLDARPAFRSETRDKSPPRAVELGISSIAHDEDDERPRYHVASATSAFFRRDGFVFGLGLGAGCIGCRR